MLGTGDSSKSRRLDASEIVSSDHVWEIGSIERTFDALILAQQVVLLS